MIDCTERDRTRIFNLGYYTWVEQQGTPFELFEQRRQQAFWRGLRRYVAVWDEMITEFNARVGGVIARDRRLPLRGLRRHRRHRRRRTRAGARGPPPPIRHHVLHPLDGRPAAPRRWSDPNPFVAFGPRLAWWAFARTPRDDGGGVRRASTRTLADGFTVTAFARLAARSSERDRRERVGEGRDRQRRRQPQGPPPRARSCSTSWRPSRSGSSTRARPPLAIASCGNAAIAAATLAAAGRVADRRVRADVGRAGGARAARVARRAASTRARGGPTTRRATRACTGSGRPSPPGRCRSACRDRRTRCASTAGARSGGRWLPSSSISTASSSRSAAARWRRARGWGLGPDVRLDAVQTAGCAPLARALALAVADPGASWPTVMRPWDDPHSAADGILDDETYDWLGVSRRHRALRRPVAGRAGGGDRASPRARRPDRHPGERHRHRRPGRPPAPDGAPADPDERVAVIFSGVQR